MSAQQSPVRSALTHAGHRVVPESSQANPRLRQVIADRRELAAMTRDRVSSPIAAFRFYAGTTPGRLVVIMLAMILACALTGWYSSSALSTRSETLATLIDRTEPLAESAEVLYSSLSVADAAANSAFISGGRESTQLRHQYADAVASAGTALVASADAAPPGEETTDGDQPAIRSDLALLATQIPVYTGLIETARTNNRLGNPVGSAYLVQASSLMQDQILPAAKRLYDQRSTAISEPQRTLTVPPWGVYVALAGTILMLALVARYLALRTRRHFNIGLILALASLVVGTLWLLVTGLTSVAAANTAKNGGADPLHELTSMRILTQQARSVETLSLVRRTAPAQLDQDFTGSIDRITAMADTLIAQNPDAAEITEPLEKTKGALHQWAEAHSGVTDELTSGDFAAAVDQTIGTSESSTATGYTAVNDSLLRAIADTRATFRDKIHTAQQLLGFTGSGIGLLCALAALSVVGGLIPRIREYR